MNSRFGNLLGGISMYRLMLYYLLLLLAAAVGLALLGLLPYKPWDIALSGASLVLVCYLSNKFLAWVVRTKPNLESRSITALILALIIGPLPFTAKNLASLAVIGGLAMISKYAVVIKKRHIFNPAAFTAVLSALFFRQTASWWVGTPWLLPFVLLGGLVVLQKIKRVKLVLAFLLTYLVLSVGAASGHGIPLPQTASLVGDLLRVSPLVFFSLVMLVEPLTGPQGTKPRVYCGVAVALILFSLQQFFPQIPYSLELALVLGNLTFRIFALDPRLSLILQKREQIGANTYDFWFTPEKALAFVPGQFLEWTLPHSRPDSRGTRRYFTIASSPTEQEIMLATRIGADSSSFKKKLLGMKGGQEIVVSNLEGEFVLPKDQSEPLVFIAGGIGITPFRSMVKYLLDKNEKRPITLLYANRTAQDIPFRDFFDEAARRLEFKVVYAVGAIEEKLVRTEVASWEKALYYVSGPEPMVEAMGKKLLGWGIPKSQLKRDYFPGYA